MAGNNLGSDSYRRRTYREESGGSKIEEWKSGKEKAQVGGRSRENKGPGPEDLTG